MRACVQRVTSASVAVGGKISGEIGGGFLILLGIAASDTDDDLNIVVNKLVNLRILPDAGGVMNKSALDVLHEGHNGSAMLVVSQFTLYADIRRGRRPGWSDAASPDIAAPMVDRFVLALKEHGFQVETGVFGAEMRVSLVNDGPVTIWIDSEELRGSRRGVSNG